MVSPAACEHICLIVTVVGRGTYHLRRRGRLKLVSITVLSRCVGQVGDEVGGICVEILMKNTKATAE